MDTSTTAKRKRPDTDTAGEVAGDDDVSDAEVEEFYAILRRMRDASRRPAPSAAGGDSRAPQPAPTWRPSFSWEDFAPAPAPAPAPAAPEERVAENATPPRPDLDLNAEPEPEAHPPPATARLGGEVTTLCARARA